MLDSDEWNMLCEHQNALKESFGMPRKAEFKYEYLWFMKNDIDQFGQQYDDFAHLDLKDALEFVRKSLTRLSACADVRLILTVTKNARITWKNPKEMLIKWHLEDLMVRVEYQIQNQRENLAIFFCDNEAENVDEAKIRSLFFESYWHNRFIRSFKHLMPSVSFVDSEHCLGLQMADYCAGAFHGLLKGYSESRSLFAVLHPTLIRKGTELMGVGVKEIPSREEDRLEIKNVIERAIAQASS